MKHVCAKISKRTIKCCKRIPSRYLNHQEKTSFLDLIYNIRINKINGYVCQLNKKYVNLAFMCELLLSYDLN